MAFHVEMFVHFDEGDPGKIMFFPNFFRLSQRAFELCLVHHKVNWNDWFDHPDWGVPLRKVSAEYLHPMRAGQTAKLGLSVVKIGDTSLTLKTEVANAKGTTCAIIETTHVFVDAKTIKKRSIPQPLRKFLETI